MEEIQNSEAESAVQEEQEIMSKVHELFLDTKKVCFLCLQEDDCESASENDTFTKLSLQSICRYLNINPYSIIVKSLNIGGEEYHSDVSFLKNKCKFSVLLCGKCASLTNSLSDMISQMELMKMLMSHQLKVILQVFKDSGHESLWKDAKDKMISNFAEPLDVWMVETLRKETNENCYSKMKHLVANSSPKVELERLEILDEADSSLVSPVIIETSLFDNGPSSLPSPTPISTPSLISTVSPSDAEPEMDITETDNTVAMTLDENVSAIEIDTESASEKQNPLSASPSSSNAGGVAGATLFSGDGAKNTNAILESGEVTNFNINDVDAEDEGLRLGGGQESIFVDLLEVKLKGFGEKLEEMEQLLDELPVFASNKKERFETLKREIQGTIQDLALNEVGILVTPSQRSVDNEANLLTMDSEMQTTEINGAVKQPSSSKDSSLIENSLDAPLMEVNSLAHNLNPEDIWPPAVTTSTTTETDLPAIRSSSEDFSISVNDVFLGSSEMEIEASPQNNTEKGQPESEVNNYEAPLCGADIQQQTPEPSTLNAFKSNQGENKDDPTIKDTEPALSVPSTFAPQLRRSKRKVRKTLKISQESRSEEPQPNDDDNTPPSEGKMIQKPAEKRRLREYKSKHCSATIPSSSKSNVHCKPHLPSSTNSLNIPLVYEPGNKKVIRARICTICNLRVKGHGLERFLEHSMSHERPSSSDEQPLHSCDHCERKFSLELNLKLHKIKAHKLTCQTLTCDVCQDSTQKSRVDLITHLKTHSMQTPIHLCKSCPMVSSSLDNMLSHMVAKHVNSRILPCPECDQFVASLPNELYQHCQESHPDSKEKSTFDCDHCTRKFLSPSTLELHLKRDHPEDDDDDSNEGFRCSTCNNGKNYKSKEYLERHMVYMHTKDEDKPYQCDQCDLRFLYNSFLLLHIKQVHETVRYNCLFCERQFCVQNKFARHLETHAGQGQFICEICGKRFPNAEQLIYHWKVHSPKTMMVCNICGKFFEQKRYLKKHVGRVHKPLRNRKCEKCGDKFKLPSHLKAHMAKHSVEKPFICPVCGQGFNQKTTVIDHMMKTYDLDKEVAYQLYHDEEDGKGKAGGAKH